MNMPEDDLDALMASLRQEFLQACADRVDSIEREAGLLPVSADPKASLTVLVREAHTLKGGGAIFGFSSLGEAGAEVEREGRALLTAGLPLPSCAPLLAAVTRLGEALLQVRGR